MRGEGQPMPPTGASNLAGCPDQRGPRGNQHWICVQAGRGAHNAHNLSTDTFDFNIGRRHEPKDSSPTEMDGQQAH